MRLIDADALLRKWQDVLNEKADEKGTVAYITFELFIDRLKEEPTIYAVPDVDCDGGCVSHLSDFCPNCGAKMDGGKNYGHQN